MTSPVADPECPRCQGGGWVKVADGGAGAASPCDCRASRRVPNLLAAAEIPVKYADCTFQNFRTDFKVDIADVLQGARSQCKAYVEGFLSAERGSSTERGVLLSGPPGVGKTHLAVATLKELVRLYGVTARFLDFSSFLAEIRATFDPDSTDSKHKLLDPVLKVDVLLFDELGASQTTPFVQDVIYLIVNGRYLAKRATIFTSNFRPLEGSEGEKRSRSGDRLNSPMPFDLSAERASTHDSLVDRISPMLLSRVMEMSRWIEIRAGKWDYRMYSNRAVRAR